ncbi:MAG: alpha-N-acetylglucosaminidase N-terminal domain-containing protein, partial [Candidatus Hydrogenedentes bacterium]|nr:alpha-N-acetylglucosaminidase N-terminal domain-containing protein [Candidatus Hydrogenedentota bacterium]
MFKCTLFFALMATIFPVHPSGAETVEAARALLQRVIPEHASDFDIETLPAEDGRDVFEIESVNGRIALRGSNGIAIASALNHYLKSFCNASFSLHGSQLALPDPLPNVAEPVRVVTPFEYRYCFNYCCFSYSMAWWNWPQWERVIDWMALQGINLPLSVTGQEAVWQSVYRNLGLSDEEIGAFIVGPAFLPFGWMGCMDGWGGPLPQSWIDGHRALQEQIVARE